MTDTTEITETDVQTALDVLERFKRLEDDGDHKQALEDVREMIVGVYNVDDVTEPPTVAELQTAKAVIEAVDPDDQHWHDPSYVERERRYGINWCDIGIEYIEDTTRWEKDDDRR